MWLWVIRLPGDVGEDRLTVLTGPDRLCILLSAPRNEHQRFTEAVLGFFSIKLPPGRWQKFQQTIQSSAKTVHPTK